MDNLLTWFIVLVLFIAVGSLLWWALNKLLAAFATPQPFATIAQVVFIVVLCFVLLGLFTGYVPLAPMRLRG